MGQDGTVWVAVIKIQFEITPCVQFHISIFLFIYIKVIFISIFILIKNFILKLVGAG